MGNETAGDIPSYDTAPSIIQLSLLQWSTLRIASALKVVEFVTRVGRLSHQRHPVKIQLPLRAKFHGPRQAFASHGTAATIRDAR
jgi:hypothetical protein